MDSWIKPFEMGMTCYDKQAKEFVHITNGLCILDHSSPEAFKTAHTSGCIYAPSEAVALRVIGNTKNGDPIIAFTYRGVDPQHLTPSYSAHDPYKIFDATRKSRKIGRV